MNKKSLIKQIVGKVKNVVGETVSFIPLHEPRFCANESELVKDCIDSGWVSSVGKYVDLFERKLEQFTGAKHAIATMNGTAALHVCLVVCGVKPQHEVIMPALTFVATANAISYCGATPHFVDSSFQSLGICPDKLLKHLTTIAKVEDGKCFNRRTGRVIKAIIPMHTFGHSVDLDPIKEICGEFCITLIEDAAESLGTYYKGRHTGNIGKVSALSFNGNKIITTGGGGAVLTNDKKLAAHIKHLTTTAKKAHPWEFEHDYVGYNYRLPNINAAIGCAQMESLPDFIALKRKLAKQYIEAFADFKGVSVFQEPEFSKSNYWLNNLILETADVDFRNQLLKALNESGIGCRPVWKLISELKMYENCPRADLLNAIQLVQNIISLPSSVFLGEKYA